MHRARAALPVITTLLCASKGYSFTDAIQQSRPGIDAKLVVRAIDAENQGNRPLDVRRVRACHRGPPVRTVARLYRYGRP